MTDPGSSVGPRPSVPLPDLATLVGVALVAYAAANLLHEAVGHGGACVVLGGKPEVLSSIHFECDIGPRTLARRGLAAAGTIVNFIAGALALVAARSIEPRKRPPAAYFLWLFATLNLLMGAGYFMFSGVGNIGDWAAVAGGLLSPWIWRPALALFGAALYFVLARHAAGRLRAFVGGDATAAVRGRRLAIPAYLAGGLLYCVSGLFNPHGPILIAISAAAASFGGASGLLWLSAMTGGFDGPADAVELQRSYPWIAAGLVASLLFIAVLGPGIRFAT